RGDAGRAPERPAADLRRHERLGDERTRPPVAGEGGEGLEGPRPARLPVARAKDEEAQGRADRRVLHPAGPGEVRRLAGWTKRRFHGSPIPSIIGIPAEDPAACARPLAPASSR